jgi:predicted Kef-type K+ transport protein
MSALIGVALVLGFMVWRLGLPPLVGFLMTGFIFSALDFEAPEVLHEVADAGVLILLFSVGLKLRFKTLMQAEVWGSATAHLGIVTALVAAFLMLGAGFTGKTSLTLAVALAFSSTVLAAKVLEALQELRAVHGRVAIGILIVQDLAAVALLAIISAKTPSPLAVLLLALPFLRPLMSRLLDLVGHGELLVLFGAVVAIAIGGAGFEAVGMTPELGALLFGVLLADHPRAQELTNAIWGLKELLLVAFFLEIGLSGLPTLATLQMTFWALLLLPVKVALLYVLLLAFGLRSRTSLLTSLSLATYSEFGLIVVREAVDVGMLGNDWLIMAALTVAISFAFAAWVNTRGHRIYERFQRLFDWFERSGPHPDDEPITLGSAEILIVGMGRLGTGAYDYLHEAGELVAGCDSDPGKLELHRAEGRRVVYADSEDASFWQRLNLERLRIVMIALPDFNAKKIAGRELRRRGFAGLLTATHVFPEEREPILEAGFDATYNYFTEAGVGFAREIMESEGREEADGRLEAATE